MLKFAVIIIIAVFIGGFSHLILPVWAPFLTASIVLIFNVVPFYYAWFKQASTQKRIDCWLQENNLKAVNIERPFLRSGPFFLTNDCQLKYFVTAETSDGKWIYFWLVFGGWWIGMISEKFLAVETNPYGEKIESSRPIDYSPLSAHYK